MSEPYKSQLNPLNLGYTVFSREVFDLWGSVPKDYLLIYFWLAGQVNWQDGVWADKLGRRKVPVQAGTKITSVPHIAEANRTTNKIVRSALKALARKDLIRVDSHIRRCLVITVNKGTQELARINARRQQTVQEPDYHKSQTIKSSVG